MLLEAINYIVDFKPFEHKVAQEALANYEFTDSAAGFLNDQGFLFVLMNSGIILIAFMLLLRHFAMKKSKKVGELITKLLKPHMWGSIISCLLEGFLVMSVNGFHQANKFSELSDSPF